MKNCSVTPWMVVALLSLAGCNTAPSSTSSPTTTVAPAVRTAPTADQTPASVASPPDVSVEPSVDDTSRIAINTVIIPGERVGDITATTSRAELAELFGEAALTDEDVNVGEGFVEPGTRVDLGNGRSLSIIWSDTTRTQPVQVRNFGSGWHVPEGIRIGTSFPELHQILGPFELSGFGWDYGGTLSLKGTKLANYEDLLVVRVQPEAELQTSGDYQAVMGEELYPDSDPHLRSLNLRVNEMIVYLKPQ
ncbi:MULTISPECIES: hypothetical protein [unclassified Leptolyngbya]|uniref:hypothetical protein n=1 Tax=unclassified Leptolyngbya TaxID=2650499 RepID=UPI00168A0EAA|nr:MULTISPECIES: hypothetical protein [unclassified Leptolyngbya]MBD1913539.1 hypothetical protein [Leptolyngbya sp. FACHB-8]MBD2155890.1 hypothetical protein [Leptolyngbya sp. FACHB-16]